ncbi:MAG TPA: hypothetical protein DIV56_00310 [Lachnospiraceae bacterium]|nr:hypothetical protein [Lachnospiraceae bacterium]
MKHCNGIMHTVRSGDTLYSISMEHQVPLALLLRANPYVDVYNLQVGETICVPVRANDQPVMPPYGRNCSKWEVRDAVPMTETENKLAEEMTQEKDESEMMQEKDESEMPQEKDQSVYIVRDGDTLESILGVDRIVLQPGTALYRQK